MENPESIMHCHRFLKSRDQDDERHYGYICTGSPADSTLTPEEHFLLLDVLYLAAEWRDQIKRSVSQARRTKHESWGDYGWGDYYGN